MTDKTDALRARELLAAEYTKRGMGVDFVNDAGTPTAIALAAIREALAAPAEGGQGEAEPGDRSPFDMAMGDYERAAIEHGRADDNAVEVDAAAERVFALFNAKRATPPASSVDVQTIALIANMAAYIRAEGGEDAGALLSHADKLIDSAGGAKVDIPSGIYFSAEKDNFYRALDHEGMGTPFYNKWHARRDEFPRTGAADPEQHSS